MKGWVHELRGDAKAAEHFNCKVLEIGMAAKNCPDAHQECSIQGCHDDDATNPVSHALAPLAPLAASQLSWEKSQASGDAVFSASSAGATA